MNKPALTCMAFIFACTVHLANAQTSVNTISITNNDNGESGLNSLSEGISFTPDGILRTTESGGTKSIKNIPAPVVTKKPELPAVEEHSAIEKMSPLQYKYAMLLNVDVESLKNISLLAFIDNWFGTRYRYGGTTKRGIDCSALTGALLLAVYGFNMPRTAREQYRATEHIGKDELKEGDLVFFNTRGGVSHVGVYLDNDYFVEASSHGVKISSLDDHYYRKRFICGGRVSQDKMSDIN
ncbi:MAG TPA: C40 family peptidase [Hanamia sp.]|nr:C40 family peptidase [Hanamia sp.]